MRTLLSLFTTSLSGCFGDVSKSLGVVWRFAPMADDLVSEWHSRDLDSRPSARERAAVDEWLRSGRKYHAMRDHKFHRTPLLAGMFGARDAFGKRRKMDRELVGENNV